MTFAERLRQLRDDMGLSEARLAVASGIPVATVHNYALGRRKPSLAAAVKLARALGVTCEAFSDCEDIQGDEEAPAPSRPAGRRPPKAAAPVAEKAKPRGRPKKGK